MRALVRFWEWAYQSAYEGYFRGLVPRDYGVLAVWIGRVMQMAFFAVGLSYPLFGAAIRFSAHFAGTWLRPLALICAVIVLVPWLWLNSAIGRAMAAYLCQVAVDWCRRSPSQTRQPQ